MTRDAALARNSNVGCRRVGADSSVEALKRCRGALAQKDNKIICLAAMEVALCAEQEVTHAQDSDQ
jgi:hypothetical protein